MYRNLLEAVVFAIEINGEIKEAYVNSNTSMAAARHLKSLVEGAKLFDGCKMTDLDHHNMAVDVCSQLLLLKNSISSHMRS